MVNVLWGFFYRLDLDFAVDVGGDDTVGVFGKCGLEEVDDEAYAEGN